MRLQAALAGNLEKIMAAATDALAKGATDGVRQTTAEMKADLRRQTAAAGLPEKVQKAWQDRLYPKRKNSLGAAGLVYSRARNIHAAFASGGEIRAKNGRFLVIPLPAAVRLGLHMSHQRSRGSRPRRWSEVQPAIDRFGALRMVKLSGGRFLLVADQVTASGRRSKARRTRDGLAYSTVNRRGRMSMPLFLLLPRVRLGKRIDFEGARARAQRRLPMNVAAAQAAEAAALDARSGRGGRFGR